MRKRIVRRECVWMGIGALLLLLQARPATALTIDDLVTFPLTGVSASFDLADPTQVTPLAKDADYEYFVERLGAELPSGNDPDPADPSTWTVLHYRGTVTWLGSSGTTLPAQAEEPLPPRYLLLVFTSLRQGEFSTELPPRIDGGYLRSSLEDERLLFVRDPLAAEGGDPGVVIDEEGEFFIGLPFEPLSGVPQEFLFDIVLTEPLVAPLAHFNRGFLVPIPEPSSGLLAGAGSLLLVGMRRRAAGTGG